MWAIKWNVTCSPLDEYPYKNEVLELDMINYWYEHPLERLSSAPENRYCIVQFDELIANPVKVVQDIYQKFEFEMNPRLKRRLNRVTSRSKKKASRIKYSLHKMGLSTKWINIEFSNIFKRFGFKKRDREYWKLRRKMNRIQFRLIPRPKQLKAGRLRDETLAEEGV